MAIDDHKPRDAAPKDMPSDKPKRRLADIHGDAIALTGLLYVLDQWTPGRDDMKGRGAVVDLI